MRPAQQAPRAVGDAPDLAARARHLRGLMGELSLAATAFLPMAKVEETARHWLLGGHFDEDAAPDGAALADALLLALDVGLFAPSASGATALDRLARRQPPEDPDARAALDLLRRAAFRVLRIEDAHPDGGWRLADLATGEALRLLDDTLPADCAGLAIAARLAVLERDVVLAVGPLTPLDETALDLARARMRPLGRGLTNPNRCAEAIYRHAVRYGAPEIPGLNRPADGEEDGLPFGPEDGPVHALAFAWAETGQGAPPPDGWLAAARGLGGTGDLLESLGGCLWARSLALVALADAYECLLTVQVETVERRAVVGVGLGIASLDSFAADLAAKVREGIAPPGVDELLAQVRERVRLGGLGRASHAADADLDRVLTRIQALRAMTVDRGCTEAEAITAAGKVAELLDRYGLTLGEVELKQQACAGFGVDTGRRRFGPIDGCVPTVGAFCDCRVWSEQAANGEIRYVFFGLPADMAGARYLYELVESTFATETDRFRRSELHAGHHGRQRRSATHAFQTGLAHGIAARLDSLRRDRDSGLRARSGRDLVPLKQAMIEEELARLGLSFHARDGAKGRYLLRDAYEAGQEAGDRFEHRPGIDRRSQPR